jgi:ABC-2 type transport system ATP-binding protein
LDLHSAVVAAYHPVQAVETEAFRVDGARMDAGSSGRAIVSAENLVRRFGTVQALSGISFSVREGEVFGFLGPNGAGKTTTINILCTLLRPSAGRAVVNGFDVTHQRSQVRHSIGLVFQEPTLDDYLTAEQNLRFHAYAYALPRADRERRMRELLTLVELWDRRGGKIQTFSGGMRRRLEIARGLLHRPRVLFLDEPTLGLDPQTRRHIWDYVRDLRREESLSIFLSTNYMDEAEYCDRIAIIDQGRVVALDTPEALKDQMGGDMVSLATQDNVATVGELAERYGLQARSQDGMVSLVAPRGGELVPVLIRELSQEVISVSVRRPTLDDVFLKLTGRAIREQGPDQMAPMRMRGMLRRPR